MNIQIQLRQEEPKDYAAVEALTREAFWNLYVPGCDEHYLAHILRDHEDFIPALDFVAEIDGKIVGNIMYTRSSIVGEDGVTHPTATFGPLSVLPSYQRSGVGKALISHTAALCKEMGYKAIVILGSPHYYCYRGFQSAKSFGVSFGDDRYPFAHLILPLGPGAMDGVSGVCRMSPVFDGIDAAAVAAFDSRFPPKEKAKTLSQVEFAINVTAYLSDDTYA